MSTTTEEIEYGVRYLNGTEDWNTAQWFGTIDIPESRATFREQYDLRLAGFGSPPLPLIFLRRKKTLTYDDAEVLEDLEETIDPEPTPEEVNEDGTEPGTDPEPERQ